MESHAQVLKKRVTFKTLFLITLTFLAGCGGSESPPSAEEAIADVRQRENNFPNFPTAGITYLSFDLAHGFQVNYFSDRGIAWLWYPGNHKAVPEEYKLSTISGQHVVCFRHPPNSYNPVIGTSGGSFKCASLDFTQRGTVAQLAGDPFGLSSGRVPIMLDRCTAPVEFQFDRARFVC